MLRIGNAYKTGKGVPQSYPEALRWYKRQKKGISFSFFFVFISSYLSIFNRWKESAERGEMLAMHACGVAYYQGQGAAVNPNEVKQEKKNLHNSHVTFHFKAFRYLKMAAEAGYHPSQSNLGVCYETGKGTPKDLTQAIKWYLRAALGGNSAGKTNIARLEAISLSSCYQALAGLVGELMQSEAEVDFVFFFFFLPFL